MKRNNFLAFVAIGLMMVSNLVIAGPATGPAWAWAAGKITNNGSVQLKSANGNATYNVVQNPTGVMVKSNQSALTQPPAVIISGGFPCFVGMLKENRKKYCAIGADVYAGADDPTVIGKYAGFITVRTRTRTSPTATPVNGSFQYDFIVDLADKVGQYSCFSSGNWTTSYASYVLDSTMGLMKYRFPPELPPLTEIHSADFGILLSSDWWYSNGKNGECPNKSYGDYQRSAIQQCAEKGRGWYLPSVTELTFMHAHRSALGGFLSADYLSSQNPGSLTDMHIVNFSTGIASVSYRNQIMQYRCTRVFNELIVNPAYN